MAFPVIETADTKNGVQTSNSTSWTLTYPTNLVAGDLILGWIGADGDPTVTVTGFNKWGFRGNASAVKLYAFAKISDGTETGTFTASLSATEQGAWRVFRITGWWGSLLPATQDPASGASNNSGMSVSPETSGSSNVPNPPSLDPSSWATEDTLWFAACAADTSRTISVYPLADNNTADVSGGSTGATLGLCTLNSAVASLDPGTFTISAADDWATATLAVRPAVPAVPRVPYVNRMPQLLAH